MNVDTLIPVNYEILTLLMFFVNGVIFCICVCRLKLMRDVIWRVKIQYVIGTVVAAANGLAPIFFRQWPNSVSFAFTVWVCYVMLSDSYQWREGVPKAAIKKDEGSKDESS